MPRASSSEFPHGCCGTSPGIHGQVRTRRAPLERPQYHAGMLNDVTKLFVSQDETVRAALTRSNETRIGILLVVDKEKRLLAVITDGDFRRAFLAGVDLEMSVRKFMEKKGPGKPISAHSGIGHADLVDLLRRSSVSHVPLVDGAGRVERLVGMEDLLQEDEQALQAVVMAGGKGTRLHPLTQDLPKPMLPVGDRPLMERIIQQLSDTGIRQVSVTTHYQAEKISEHFGDGERFGVSLRYVPEDEQLGTAGGLALLPAPDSTLLVINGDILTEVDFKAMLSFHREHKAAMTVAVRRYEFQIPYGVVETEGAMVREIQEKPMRQCFVSAGIYLLEPDAHALIPRGRHFDMPDLIGSLVESSMRVVSFPIWEYWRDIGEHGDYAKAQADMKDGTVSR